MFCPRIIISHGIAVKWYLKVYWLLPLSIVDSFAENRRFFWKASTTLLPSTDDSFAEHHEYLGQSINFISKRSHFLLSPDSFSLHQLNQQTTWQNHTESTDTCHNTILFLLIKRSYRTCWARWFVGPCQDMCLHYWRTGINETKSLPWLAPYNKKGNDSGIYSNCYFPSHLKIDWLGLDFLKE